MLVSSVPSRVAEGDRPLEHVAPVRAGAPVARQTGQQRTEVGTGRQVDVAHRQVTPLLAAGVDVAHLELHGHLVPACSHVVSLDLRAAGSLPDAVGHRLLGGPAGASAGCPNLRTATERQVVGCSSHPDATRSGRKMGLPPDAAGRPDERRWRRGRRPNARHGEPAHRSRSGPRGCPAGRPRAPATPDTAPPPMEDPWIPRPSSTSSAPPSARSSPASRPTELDRPTPCADFTVRGVLEHMIGGATAFAAAYRGEAPAEPDMSDPLAGFGPALEDLFAAIARPGGPRPDGRGSLRRGARRDVRPLRRARRHRPRLGHGHGHRSALRPVRRARGRRRRVRPPAPSTRCATARPSPTPSSPAPTPPPSSGWPPTPAGGP